MNSKEFPINCTGDACVGDVVKFERAVFSGTYKKPKFSHMEIVIGKIIKDSYGKEKQQHTFTLELENGTTTFIKGRNLYKNGVYRQKWDNEEERKTFLEEKHLRGDKARKQKEIRKSEKINEFFHF